MAYPVPLSTTFLWWLFGDFWHRGDNPEERIDFFAGFGYSCLVIWEHEVYAGIDAVKQRVIDFLGDKR